MTATTTPAGATGPVTEPWPVTALSEQAADLAITASAGTLHLPTVKAEAGRIAQGGRAAGTPHP